MKRTVLRSLLVVSLVSMAFNASVSARTSSRISSNYGFESGASSWTSLTADLNSIHSIEQRDWSTDDLFGREDDLQENFLLLKGQGDFGQFVTIDDKSPHQILSIMAFKQGDGGGDTNLWVGFGITYYDSSGSEIDSQRKQIVNSFGNANRGYGDGLVPHSIGLIVPQNAAFAYIWLWNADANADVYVDKFELRNSFKDDDFFFDTDRGGLVATQPPRQNAILNGDFGNLLGGDEFWQISEVFDTVFPFSNYGTVNSGYFSSMRMGGQYNPNLIYQYVGSLTPGDTYDFTARYNRIVESGSLGSGGPPAAVAGIDFFDASNNKFDAVTISMQEVSETVPNQPDEKSIATTPVTIPGNTAFAYAWVWVEPSGPNVEAPLVLEDLLLRRKNTEIPGAFYQGTVGDEYLFQLRNPGFKTWDVGLNLDNKNNYFLLRGPNGFTSTMSFTRTSGGFSGSPFVYRFVFDTPPTASGFYEIILQEDALKNGSGVAAPSEVRLSFTLP